MRHPPIVLVPKQRYRYGEGNMYKFREGSIDYFLGIGLGLLLGVSIIVTSIWLPYSILILKLINQVKELTVGQYLLILGVETFVGVIALTKVLDGLDETAK